MQVFSKLLPQLEHPEILCQLVLGDTPMGRETHVAGFDVDLVVGVFASPWMTYPRSKASSVLNGSYIQKSSV